MASSLTQADVARLLAEPSAAARAEVADKLAREIDSTLLTAAELRIAHDIVRIMAQDAELAVRRALSHSLRSATQSAARRGAASRQRRRGGGAADPDQLPGAHR